MIPEPNHEQRRLLRSVWNNAYQHPTTLPRDFSHQYFGGLTEEEDVIWVEDLYKAIKGDLLHRLRAWNVLLPTMMERFILVQLDFALGEYHVARREAMEPSQRVRHFLALADPIDAGKVPAADKEAGCPICYCQFGEMDEDSGVPRRPCKTIRCNHIFCSVCLRKLLSGGPSSCPMCREPFPDLLNLDAEQRVSRNGADPLWWLKMLRDGINIEGDSFVVDPVVQ